METGVVMVIKKKSMDFLNGEAEKNVSIKHSVKNSLGSIIIVTCMLPFFTQHFHVFFPFELASVLIWHFPSFFDEWTFFSTLMSIQKNGTTFSTRFRHVYLCKIYLSFCSMIRLFMYWWRRWWWLYSFIVASSATKLKLH